MSAPQTTADARKKTALVPLLYWLLVIAGLAGFTLKRIDGDTKDLLPIWTGTLFGVVLGQLLGWKRVRAWVPIVVLLGCFWLAPAFYVALYEIFGSAAGTWVLAFLPAAVCAYLSLSERCGLVAFWYPAVLWMLVVFDGASPSSIDMRGALPIFVGLTALFAWFLRARETRRAQIWLEHSSERLATPIGSNVLRSSPLRAANDVAWTGFAGASALVLAAWVAPHLLQTDKSEERARFAAAAGNARGTSTSGGKPCCPARGSISERERTREYFSILRSAEGRDHDMFESDTPSWCQVCPAATGVAIAGTGDGDGSYFGMSGGYTGAPGGTYAGAGESYGLPGSAYDGVQLGAGNDPYTITATTPSPPTVYEPVTVPTPTTTVTALPPAQVAPVPPPVPTTKPTVAAPAVATSKPVSGSRGPSTSAAPTALDPATPSGPSIPWPSPWRAALALALSFVTFRFLARITRRRIVLRHLANPYWNESVDQRISNHWQRMLIGLRDAGIVPKRDEQPLVFARRIGIEGATQCATILERARHGVRVESADVDEMGAAATAVYESARARAGVAARAAAALRWPLA